MGQGRGGILLDESDDGLVVQIDDRGVPPGCDLAQERRFSRSARPLQQDGGLLLQEIVEDRKRVAADVASDDWFHAASLPAAIRLLAGTSHIYCRKRPSATDEIVRRCRSSGR